MKYIFTLLILTLLFSGCSHKNAFTKFGMNEEKGLVESSLLSGEIKSDKKIEGVFSAIYLNEVCPESYNQNEYFYIFIYLKDNEEIYDPNSTDDIDLVLKLNGVIPLKIKQLSSKNQFSHLTNNYSDWNKHYLVAFKEQGKKLNLVLESDQFSSVVLKYQKDEQ